MRCPDCGSRNVVLRDWPNASCNPCGCEWQLSSYQQRQARAEIAEHDRARQRAGSQADAVDFD